MPFDEGEQDEGGGDWDCDLCEDHGYVHVLRLRPKSRWIEAEPCPRACKASSAWLAHIDRCEREARRAMDAIFGTRRDG